jgi:hypothetical protein
MALPKLPCKVQLSELVGLPTVHYTDRPFCYYFLLFLFCILIAVVGIKLKMPLNAPSNPRLPAWIGIVITVLMLASAVCLFWF